jgi:hypothetical protein
MTLTKGQLVRFAEEKRPYRVKAANERFAVCTKPYPGSCLYTIIDFEKQIRGTENLIFCMGFTTAELCEEALERLTTGETKVSHRNRCELNIVEVK